MSKIISLSDLTYCFRQPLWFVCQQTIYVFKPKLEMVPIDKSYIYHWKVGSFYWLQNRDMRQAHRIHGPDFSRYNPEEIWNIHWDDQHRNQTYVRAIRVAGYAEDTQVSLLRFGNSAMFSTESEADAHRVLIALRGTQREFVRQYTVEDSMEIVSILPPTDLDRR